MQERRSEISPKMPSITIISISKANSSPDLRPSNQPRPSISRDPSSKTEDLLSLIPKTTTPEITSLLLAELAKPVSPTTKKVTSTCSGSQSPLSLQTHRQRPRRSSNRLQIPHRLVHGQASDAKAPCCRHSLPRLLMLKRLCS
jgi:hypothetical protein